MPVASRRSAKLPHERQFAPRQVTSPPAMSGASNVGAKARIRSAHDGMGRAMQRLDALDGDRPGPLALDMGAHGTQAAGEIDDLGLARSVCSITVVALRTAWRP